MLTLYKGIFHDFTGIYMHWGDHIVTFCFSNSLLLQASLHLIPQIDMSIYFCVLKELSITPVIGLPQPQSKRSKGTSVLTAPACLYLRLWRQASFFLPKRQLKGAATNPPMHLPTNPYSCTYSLEASSQTKITRNIMFAHCRIDNDLCLPDVAHSQAQFLRYSSLP